MILIKVVFSRNYIWSPSIEVDNTWKPVKDYIRDHIKPNDRETCYFNSYDPAELEQVINAQNKVIDYQKEQEHKYLYKILIGIDGFQMIHFLHENHNFYTSYT